MLCDALFAVAGFVECRLMGVNVCVTSVFVLLRVATCISWFPALQLILPEGLHTCIFVFRLTTDYNCTIVQYKAEQSTA